MICTEQQIAPVLATPEGVETVLRTNGKHDYLFLMNHTTEPHSVTVNRDYYDILNEFMVDSGEDYLITGHDVKKLESR